MRSRSSSAIRSFTIPLMSLAAAAAIAGAGCAATDDDPVAAGGTDPTSTTTPVAPASSGTSLGARSPSLAAGLGTGTDPAQFTGRIERTYYDDFHAMTFRTEYHLRTADGRRLKLDLDRKSVV